MTLSSYDTIDDLEQSEGYEAAQSARKIKANLMAQGESYNAHVESWKVYSTRSLGFTVQNSVYVELHNLEVDFKHIKAQATGGLSIVTEVKV